jgi:hypothetical protein
MKEIVLGFARHALTAGGGALATKGFIGASEVEGLVGAILTIVGVVWSVVAKRKAAAPTSPA